MGDACKSKPCGDVGVACRCAARFKNRPAIPTITMIDAGAPQTRRTPMKSTMPRGVKLAMGANRAQMASQSQDGRIHEGETSRRKKESAQTADRRPTSLRHTLKPKGKGKRSLGNRTDNAPEIRNDLWNISGHPGGMLPPSPDAKCHTGTWKPAQALSPQGLSRTLAACLSWVGNRPSKPGGNTRDTPNSVKGH
jgi:hypothetical protein